MLIEVDDGTIINTDFVREAKRFRGADADEILLVWGDGTRDRYSDRRRTIEWACGHIVSAAPGYWFASADIDDDGVSFDILPVLAFRYDRDDEFGVIPITPEGEPSSRDGKVLVYPDGRCWDVVGGPRYASLEEWKASEEQRLHAARSTR